MISDVLETAMVLAGVGEPLLLTLSAGVTDGKLVFDPKFALDTVADAVTGLCDDEELFMDDGVARTLRAAIRS